jgi:hypothetical protein
MIKQLLPTELWAVEVPSEGQGFSKEVDYISFYIDPYHDPRGRRVLEVPFAFEILGECTQHSISFDIRQRGIISKRN